MKRTMILLFLLASIPLFANNEPQDTDGNGYRNISTLEQLRWVSENDSSWTWNFELDNDIGAKATKKWNDGRGWSPIGNEEKPFSGNFNGNGYAIDSLYINQNPKLKAFMKYREKGFWGACAYHTKSFFIRNKESLINKHSGFFGVIQPDTNIINSISEIYNFHITNCNFTIRGLAGGLAGNVQSANIKLCSVTGSICSTGSVGGLIANILETEIISCYVRANVYSLSIAAGFVVESRSSNISQCYTISDIKFIFIGSGFVLRNLSKSFVSNCLSVNKIDYLYSNISYDFIEKFESAYFSYMGLFASFNGHKICNCLALSEDNARLNGKLAGFVDSNNGQKGEISCFFDIIKFGNSLNIFTTSRQPTALKYKSTYTNAGWDFENIWDINPKINDGYPFLRNVPIFE